MTRTVSFSRRQCLGTVGAVVAALEKQGVTPNGSTPEEFRELIATEIAQWSEVVREANIQPE